MALFGLRKAIILSVKRMECGQENDFNFAVEQLLDFFFSCTI